ncbi:hypothetical protein Tco_0441418 [Tanacetum coccineum]
MERSGAKEWWRKDLGSGEAMGRVVMDGGVEDSEQQSSNLCIDQYWCRSGAGIELAVHDMQGVVVVWPQTHQSPNGSVSSADGA